MEFTRRQVVKGAGKIALMVGTAGLFAACQSSGSTSLVKRAYTYN